MSMIWNFVLTLKEDGTFLLTDAEDYDLFGEVVDARSAKYGKR